MGLFDVSGKVVLVTGGSRGIGLMMARGFVEAGARTYITARSAEDCAAAAADLAMSGECIAIPGDVSTEDGRRDLAAAFGRHETRLHVLVNNAGAHWVAPIEDHGAAVWDRVFDVNVKGLFLLTAQLLPMLRAAAAADDPARVINVGSIDGITVPAVDEYAYAASKAAVHHLTRTLAKALAPDVAVNAVAPGPFESKMTEVMLERYRDAIVEAAPLRRIGKPDDMAGIALFLASPASAYITGAVVPVDGGLATTA